MESGHQSLSLIPLLFEGQETGRGGQCAVCQIAGFVKKFGIHGRVSSHSHEEYSLCLQASWCPREGVLCFLPAENKGLREYLNQVFKSVLEVFQFLSVLYCISD